MKRLIASLLVLSTVVMAAGSIVWMGFKWDAYEPLFGEDDIGDAWEVSRENVNTKVLAISKANAEDVDILNVIRAGGVADEVLTGDFVVTAAYQWAHIEVPNTVPSGVAAEVQLLGTDGSVVKLERGLRRNEFGRLQHWYSSASSAPAGGPGVLHASDEAIRDYDAFHSLRIERIGSRLIFSISTSIGWHVIADVTTSYFDEDYRVLLGVSQNQLSGTRPPVELWWTDFTLDQ